MRRIRRLLSLLLLLSGVVGADIGFITYLGGSGTDRAFTVTTDAAGNVYTVGVTDSRDFPVRNALQSTFGGGASDGFVAKLSPAGQVLWATYLGGAAQDEATRVEVDQAGNVYVVGTTRSPDFQTTPNAHQTTLKGTSDAFVVKLSPNGDKLIYSTLLGGTGDETAPGMLLDAAGFVAVAGSTGATDLIATDDAAFKTNQGGTDAYIAVLDPAGERLVYLTYFGGSGNDTLTGIALGHGGNLYFTGQTTSTNLPVSDPAYQRTLRGNGDAYLARLSPDKQRAEYVTYLGGSASDTGADVRVDFSENVFVSGNTSSTDFPVFPAGSTRYEGGESDDRYEYNARGRLAKVTRPDDTTAGFIYDEAGRLIREAYSDGAEVRYERDDRGRVVKANGLTLTYDAAGRIVESNGIRNEYDAAGRIIAIYYPPDRAVRYEYNNRGLMTRMTDYL